MWACDALDRLKGGNVRGYFAVGAVLAVACAGEPTLDGSSEDALAQSVEVVRSSLPEDRRAQLDTALLVVGMSGLDLGDLFGQAMAGTLSADQVVDDVRARLNGRTAEEVIALADSIRSALEQEQRRQAEAEIAELFAKRDSAEQARVRLTSFVVERSRLRIVENFGREVRIDLTVRNGLSEAVSRAYFRGTYQSPNRSVPWLREEFNYQIPGGLEPGETASWTLQPNVFSGSWSAAMQAPADAVLTVDVYRLEGADGGPLFGGVTWDKDDEERLAALQAALAEASQ
jgi:hypothetical protein